MDITVYYLLFSLLSQLMLSNNNNNTRAHTQRRSINESIISGRMKEEDQGGNNKCVDVCRLIAVNMTSGGPSRKFSKRRDRQREPVRDDTFEPANKFTRWYTRVSIGHIEKCHIDMIHKPRLTLALGIVQQQKMKHIKVYVLLSPASCCWIVSYFSGRMRRQIIGVFKSVYLIFLPKAFNGDIFAPFIPGHTHWQRIIGWAV